MTRPEKTLEHICHWRAAILCWQIIRMDEFIAEPRKKFWIERSDEPVNDMSDSRYAYCIGMISEPDVKLKAQIKFNWYKVCCNGVDVSWKPSDTGPLRNSPNVSATDICAKRDEPGL